MSFYSISIYLNHFYILVINEELGKNSYYFDTAISNSFLSYFHSLFTHTSNEQ